VLSYQHASDSRIDDELFDSVDIVSTFPTAHGHWLLYVEGNTTPRRNGVSTVIPEANQDAATAVDRTDSGRLQISGLHYLWYLGQDALVLGLINPAGPIDNSDIANNETSQFLGKTLVNNPTIAFPDYALGMVYFYKPDSQHIDLTFLVSSSHGLGDNPDKSYAELADITAAGKGAFAVAEMTWRQARAIWRSGIWLQTADNAWLDGSGRTESNYGVYLNTDHEFGRYGVNLRLGIANSRVSEAAQFIGVAVDRNFGRQHAGIGYTYTVVSDHASAGTGNRGQFEAYYRFDQNDHLSITPSFQRIHNSNFDQSGRTVDRDVNVVSVRASYTF